MGLLRWQLKYLLAGAVVLPFAPALYLLGRRTRRKVGLLPNAGGPNVGVTGDAKHPARLLVLGESTVAGLGAETHELALAGRFASELSLRLDGGVHWTAIGRNGVTAARTIQELVPAIPKGEFDFVLLALGGNDVLRLSSPRKWRRDMTALLDILRRQSPNAVIFLANCPMIKFSPVIPQPIKAMLWELSKLHDSNIKQLTARFENVYYYHQPASVPENFFADGIHPSEIGYAQWAASMMEFFDTNYKWMKS